MNDRVTFICQVEDFEDEKDRAENIINLLEEQDLVDCNVGIGNRTFITECVDPGNRHDININDALELANRQTFEAGGVYYFTSESHDIIFIITMWTQLETFSESQSSCHNCSS